MEKNIENRKEGKINEVYTSVKKEMKSERRVRNRKSKEERE